MLGCEVSVLLSDEPFSEYVYGHDLIGRIVSIGGQGTATYAHADALSSVQLTTDASGTQVGTTRFDAFGGIQAQTGVQLAFGFAGEQHDAESGLIYLRARYYDPTTGRFLSKDPVRGSAWRPASQHAYVYALNNPVRYRDPRGREAGEGGCCDPAFGDAVGASAPAHEPVLFSASIEPFEGGADGPACEPGIGDGDCTTTVQLEGCIISYSCPHHCECGPAGFAGRGPSPGGIRVTFSGQTAGHGARHITSTGINVSDLESMLAREAVRMGRTMSVGDFAKARVPYSGYSIEFHVYKVEPNWVNIGTYFIVP
jgi:RHS repeat-associated protein